MGPEFDTLDEKLSNALIEYLRSYGVDGQVSQL